MKTKTWKLNRVNLTNLTPEQRKNFAAFKRQILKHHRAETDSIQLSQHSMNTFSVQAFTASGKLVSDWNL